MEQQAWHLAKVAMPAIAVGWKARKVCMCRTKTNSPRHILWTGNDQQRFLSQYCVLSRADRKSQVWRFLRCYTTDSQTYDDRAKK